MNEKIKVYSQSEFDACIQLGNVAIVINCSVVARDNSSVEAWGNSSVLARGDSSVLARDNSSVLALDNSRVEARGDSRVVALGNCSVVADQNVFIRFFYALKIKASSSVVILNHKMTTTDCIEGGRILDILEVGP